jgi:hypothetical protein
MSDKALFHRTGVLVITDPTTGKEQPILPIIITLNEEKGTLEEQIAAEKACEINGKYNVYFPVGEGKLYSISDDSSSLKLKVRKYFLVRIF